MKRDQIERAEAVAELAMTKRVITQFRRMDEHVEYRKLVEKLDRETDEEQLRLLERRRYYVDHCRRMEEARQKFLADSIAEGVLELTPAEEKVFFYQKPKEFKRIPNKDKEFTAKQMEIALKSLEKRRSA